MITRLLKFKTTCRTCAALADELDLMPLFKGASSCKRSRVEIFEELVSFNLEVNPNDKLPQQICLKCIKAIESGIEFRKQCRAAQAKLRAQFLEESCSNENASIILEERRNEKIQPDLEFHDPISLEVEPHFDNSVVEIKWKVSDEEHDSWECDFYSDSNEEDDRHNMFGAPSKAKKAKPVGKTSHKTVIDFVKTENYEDIESKDFMTSYYINEVSASSSLKEEQDVPEPEVLIEENCKSEPSAPNDGMIVEQQKVKNLADTDGKARSVKTKTKTKSPSKRNPNASYPCSHCNKIFSWSIQLTNHLRKCSPSTSVKCDICTVEFETKDLLETHANNQHPLGGPPMCPLCPKTFSSSRTRNNHMRTIHTTCEECKCDICDKLFTSKIQLSNHKRRFHIIGDHECTVCHKKFKYTSTYNAHVKTHQEQPKKYNCQYCERSFKSSSRVKLHETTHTGERSHLCSVCGLTFRLAAELNHHLLTHNNDEEFKCNECEKSFITMRKLRHHILVNHKEQCHKCDVCGKLFRKKQLARHKYAAHNAPKPPSQIANRTYPFNCPVCGKGFLVAYSLLAHAKIHTEERKHACKDCGARYKRADHLQLHIKRVHLNVKDHSCDVCGKKFLEKCSLKAHMVVHQKLRPFKCTICPLDFKTTRALQTHLNKHTGEMPFVCNICNMCFANRRLLIVHTATHTEQQIKEIVNEVRIEVENATTSTLPMVIDITENMDLEELSEQLDVEKVM